MGLEILEEKFQKYIKKHPENIGSLKAIAEQASKVQKKMRDLLDGITCDVCSTCKASCCQCMPVEGWFTEGDFFLFRMFYDVPFDLKVPHGIETGCAFLGPKGCVLPADIRPFPCVKVNCKAINKELDANGSIEKYKRLCDELGRLQQRLWLLIRS